MIMETASIQTHKQPGKFEAQMQGNTDTAYLSATGIVKSFGGNRALNGVSIEVRQNEVMALVGDNGAGKSTLVKILSGAETADEGVIHVAGKQAAIHSPHDAHEQGIATLYQHLGLVDCFNVPQNVFLGRELSRRVLGIFPLLLHGEMARRTTDLLSELDIRLPDLSRPVSTMSGGQRQAVAISRLLLGNVKLIIMDEPMAALGVNEGQKVLDLIQRLAGRGISFLIISHNMEHVMSISDRIAVLKNGNMVGVVNTADTSRQEITSMIVHGQA
ncbi:ATP-binding cassette domain-containing protein [Limibacillus halophilus]|uniref:ABC-type sugar transport system ATPase subunit n=1 Tax=Limibacillus halophilus TaxID=1579333 RepID=A0A839STK7_9PROT|nr:ATP-binding cassette domain-containing protein [Limibacillus halophilus]MBB3064315.1 ABC-type sugar transport system ATPase subunit [Limibacillus halophilus]